MPSEAFGGAWIPVVDTAVSVTPEDPPSIAAGQPVRVAGRALVVLQAGGD